MFFYNQIVYHTLSLQASMVMSANQGCGLTLKHLQVQSRSRKGKGNKMGKKSRAVQQLFVESDIKAAHDLGIKLTSDFVARLRKSLRRKSEKVSQSVQYYALILDAVWEENEIDDRIFAATRLLYEYLGPSGRQLQGHRASRIDELKKLILRLAEKKQANNLPIVHKIRSGEARRRSVGLLRELT